MITCDGIQKQRFSLAEYSKKETFVIGEEGDAPFVFLPTENRSIETRSAELAMWISAGPSTGKGRARIAVGPWKVAIGQPEEFGKFEAQIKGRIESLLETGIELDQLTLDCYLRVRGEDSVVVKVQDSLAIPVKRMKAEMSHQQLSHLR